MNNEIMGVRITIPPLFFNPLLKGLRIVTLITIILPVVLCYTCRWFIRTPFYVKSDYAFNGIL